MSTLENFGWQDSSPVFYHKYLFGPIESLLPKDGSPILDVGCGNGYLANELIDKGYSVYGIDISEDGIKIANKKNKGHFFVSDAESGVLPEPLKDICFTTIISTEVIEHLYNPESYVKMISAILRENTTKKGEKGVFIVSTPYHGYLKNLMLAVCNKMDYHYSALWVGGHIKFWSKKTIYTLLNNAGFREFQFKGVGRFPYLWRHMIIRCKIK